MKSYKVLYKEVMLHHFIVPAKSKKESEVLDDVLNYMIDYMQDRCWSTQDKLAFDRIYSKLHGAKK